MQIEGIREKRIRDMYLDLQYRKLSDDSVRRLREIFEQFPGEVQVLVRLHGVPEAVTTALGSSDGKLRIRVNQNFRVRAGLELQAALGELGTEVSYSYSELSVPSEKQSRRSR